MTKTTPPLFISHWFDSLTSREFVVEFGGKVLFCFVRSKQASFTRQENSLQKINKFLSLMKLLEKECIEIRLIAFEICSFRGCYCCRLASSTPTNLVVGDADRTRQNQRRRQVIDVELTVPWNQFRDQTQRELLGGEPSQQICDY